MEIEREQMILPGESISPEQENYLLSNQFTLKLDSSIIANQRGVLATKQKKEDTLYALETTHKKVPFSHSISLKLKTSSSAPSKTSFQSSILSISAVPKMPFLASTSS